MIEAYDQRLRAVYGNEVRVHWGLMMLEPSVQQIQEMYPMYKSWQPVRDKLDPGEQFLNEWQSNVLPKLVLLTCSRDTPLPPLGNAARLCLTFSYARIRRT